MTESYQPVSCALHSEYELAIMHKDRLEIEYTDDNNSRVSLTVMPRDIQTENGAEFLLLEDEQHNKLRIRLDRISEMRILHK